MTSRALDPNQVASSEAIRNVNRRIVLNLIRTRHPISRADLARDFHPALMLFQDAVNSGQAETGAFADFFGGKEWFEDAPERGRVHALAGVRDA